MSTKDDKDVQDSPRKDGQVNTTLYSSISQTVVRGPQVVLGFCPCGPLRLNISQKKDRKNKINVNCVSHTVVENLNLLSKGTIVGWSVKKF
jgi:hypothetical protein